MEKTSEGRQRFYYYDILRIIACFSVIMLHVSAQFWYDLPITGKEWIIANAYDAAFRFGVPIFVMISGALFLDKDRKIIIKRLYTHNILRLIVPFVIWSCIYGLWDSRTFQWEIAGWKPYVLEMLAGGYHLWFVPMLAGIYLLVPILKSWLNHASKQEVEYFLKLFLIFQIGIETMKIFLQNGNILQFLNYAEIEMVCSYIGYFILGYYIAYLGIKEKWKKWIYPAGILGVFGAIGISCFLSQKRGTPQSAAFDSFSVFTFFIVIAVFFAVQEKWKNKQLSEFKKKVIKELSDATFGIYFMHILVLEWLKERNIDSMLIPNIIGIPLLAVFCFCICYGITVVLRRIPVIGKFLC